MQGTIEVPLGSIWHTSWSGRVEVVEHTDIDGEPAVRERVVRTGKVTRIPVLVEVFMRKAQLIEEEVAA